MVDADADPALVGADVVDAVGHGPAQFRDDEVVHAHLLGLGPCGRSSRPPFLKSPTSSFFLVSTEMAGCRRAESARCASLMCSNCASRSGCWRPSRVLALACRLKPRSLSRRPTRLGLARYPCPASAADRCRWLRLTHSSVACGSPRVADFTSSSKALRKPGCSLSPPCVRRHCDGSGRTAIPPLPFEVLRPRPIVLRAIPVICDTDAIPPRPAARASLAANRRSPAHRDGLQRPRSAYEWRRVDHSHKISYCSQACSFGRFFQCVVQPYRFDYFRRPARSRLQAARAPARTGAIRSTFNALALFLCCDFSSCWMTTGRSASG